MNLVNYLKEFGLEKLVSEYHIKLKKHQQYPNLILFKYEQLNSPLKNEVVQDCRGIILDSSDNWKIVSFPYVKFFNYGECAAPLLDWNHPVNVTEKLDGTMMTLYYYKGSWHVASQGKPEGGGKLATHSDGIKKEKLSDEDFKKVPTYADMFWKVWQETGCQLPTEQNTHFCFMFELVSNKNIIVVQHSMDAIYLHGVRNLKTLEEHDPKFFSSLFNWTVVPSYEFSSLDEVIVNSKKLNALEHEGFVCRDVHFNRVKIKSPLYVQISLLRSKESDGMDVRRVLSIIQMNEGEEFLTYFPIFKDLYYQQSARFIRLLSYIEKMYNSVKDITDNKEFAKVINQNFPQQIRGILFKMRKGDSARDIFSKLQVRELEQVYLKPLEEEDWDL